MIRSPEWTRKWKSYYDTSRNKHDKGIAATDATPYYTINFRSIAFEYNTVLHIEREKWDARLALKSQKIPHTSPSQSSYGTSLGVPSRNIQQDVNSVATKCRHFDEIFITGCTASCHFDNFQCSQWWKFHQNDNNSVSVMDNHDFL